MNLIAALKSLRLQLLRTLWESLERRQPGSLSICVFTCCGQSGSTPPSQGWHFFLARMAGLCAFIRELPKGMNDRVCASLHYSEAGGCEMRSTNVRWDRDELDAWNLP